jgi:hypothetical protein
MTHAIVLLIVLAIGQFQCVFVGWDSWPRAMFSSAPLAENSNNNNNYSSRVLKNDKNYNLSLKPIFLEW